MRNIETDKAGEIDLLSWSEKENKLFLIEFKRSKGTETLLRAVLEIETYSYIINHGKLLNDFEKPIDTTIRKAVLIYKNSQPYRDFYGESI